MSLTPESTRLFFLCEKVKASQACFASRIYFIHRPGQNLSAFLCDAKEMQVVAGVVLLLEFSLQFFSLPKQKLFFFLLLKSVCLATNKKLVFFSIKYYCLVEAGASNMVFGHVCRFFVSRKSQENGLRKAEKQQQKSLTKDSRKSCLSSFG